MASTAITQRPIRWSMNRGRNAIDDPSTLPDDITTESRNVMLNAVGLGSRRAGCGGGYLVSGGPTAGVRSLGAGRVWQVGGHARVVAGVDASGDLLLSDGVTPFLLPLAPVDAITGDYKQCHIVEHNGYIYVTYGSAVDRLHAIVNNFFASNPIVRTGLPAPAAPTPANTGAGAYAAVIRYYRIQWRLAAGVRTAWSNLGTSVSFTPSGAGTGVIVTKPATPANENPTGWVVFGSPDNANFYDLSGLIAIGTLTFTDTIAPSSYFSGRTAAPAEGAFTPWPSVRFLLSTGERLVGFGVFATGTLEGLSVIPGRVYFSPIANTTDTSDNERISNTLGIKGYIDLAGRTTGKIERALIGPVEDVIFAFFDVGIWSLVPTGVDTAPFRRVRLDPNLGACGQKSTFVGEDEAGAPAIYFLNPATGPMRYVLGRGFEWLGYDVQDYTGYGRLVEDAENFHGIWDARNRCARWWVECETIAFDREPTIQIVFFPRHGRTERRGEVRGGWVIHDGVVGKAAASTSGFPPYGLSPNNESDQVFIALTPGQADNYVVGVDASIDVTDNPSGSPIGGTAFDAYVLSRALTSAIPQLVNQLSFGYVQAKTEENLRIGQSAMVDFNGVFIAASDESFDPNPATQTRALKRMPSLAGLSDFYAVAIRLGDAVSDTYSIDFTTPGTITWEVPEPGTMVIEAIGGGGGTRQTTSVNAAAGGGGGEYARTSVAVSRGDLLTITVGAGGSPGGITGLPGGASSVGVVCIANGGSGAGLGAGGSGGTGGTGDLVHMGGLGGSGGCAGAVGAGGGGASGTTFFGGNGANCAIGTGGTGVAPGGNGGNGGINGGFNGSIYGGGAGGNGAGGAGGATGANGLVRIRIFPRPWTIDRWLGAMEAGSEV